VQSLDPKRGLTRLALIEGGKVKAALFIAREPIALSRGHIAAQIGQAPTPGLLAGLPGLGTPDPGATICACFNVGVATITRAIADQGLMSVEAIGAALQAGTNCGSCRPELKSLLARQLEAAE
jgi:assimilatory nitrate reductase catalytic subunit